MVDEVGGKGMVEDVVKKVKQGGVDEIVSIIGDGGESVKDRLGNQ